MTKPLADDLRFHINYQNQNKLALKDLYHHDLNLILCRNDGSPIQKSSLFNAFVRICKRAGLPKLPIHSLCHTHAVLLLEAGADVKYVQERLGHGSMEMTSDVHSQVSNKIEQKISPVLKNIWETS